MDGIKKSRTTGYPGPETLPKGIKKKKITPAGLFFKVIFSVILFAFLLVVMAGGAVGGLLGGTVYGLIKSTPELDPSILKPAGQNSFIYDTEGNVIAELKREENRVWIDYEEVPQLLVKAYVAVEDKRFWDHNGVDLNRIGAAIISYGENFLNPSVDIQGGSTITQQLIKNLTKNEDLTIKRKIQEQWQAVQLEKGLTKNEIMTYYLNNAPMGGNFIGIETAAKGYFGKDVRDLSLAECASLAGITNWPTKYMPTNETNIEANLEREKTILGLMLEQNMITQSEYDEAMAEKVQFHFNPEAGKVTKTSNQSYFVDEVIKSVKTELMKRYQYNDQAAVDIIYNGGLHIQTTMQPKVQAIVDDVYNNPDYFSAVNSKADGPPQSAMVIVNPTNGYVDAIYGGNGSKEGSVFNRATQAERSPGSSIKPLLVYGPGIETRSITAATMVDDVKQYLDNQHPDQEWPKNVENKNFGLTIVRDGLVNSRNVVATLILNNFLDINTCLDYLAKEGIDRKDEQYLSIAMGGFNKGVTPLEMAGAFTVFANKGYYTQPIFFTEIKDQNGQVILSMKPERQQVYSEQAVFIMDTMLQDVVKKGTAYPYGKIEYKETYTDDNGKEKERTVPIVSAGKTGTSDKSIDKWFCGFTPNYVGVVWYGYDKQVALTKAESAAALKIWNTVMTRVYKELKLPSAEFFDKTPPNIVTRNICMDSGKIATNLCASDPRGNRVRTEYFIEGTEPSYGDVCKIHVSAKICLDSKDAYGRYLLATEYCPPASVVERVRIKRPVEYKPKLPNDPYPVDYIYELPEGEYCTVHGPLTAIIPPVTEDNPVITDPGVLIDPITPENPDATQDPGNTQAPDETVPPDETNNP